MSLSLRKKEDAIKLPNFLFRVQHEKSTTRYVPTAPKESGKRDGILNASEEFSWEKLNRECLRPQIGWDQSLPGPSCFIPTYDDLHSAAQTAGLRFRPAASRHQASSQIFIAKIKTSTFIPAFFSPQSSNTQLKVWIQHQQFREIEFPMPVEKFWSKPSYIWISVAEIRDALNIQTIFAHKDNIWLACDYIPREHVEKLMPFDGRVVHDNLPEGASRSVVTSGNYCWSPKLGRWIEKEGAEDQTMHDFHSQATRDLSELLNGLERLQEYAGQLKAKARRLEDHINRLAGRT